ncbi:MAG: chemotaxis protein CheV [Desulfovibrionaceae bacterium]|nr:chemotaxis protein CheV [Desulfovibrionaceae bacterium]
MAEQHNILNSSGNELEIIEFYIDELDNNGETYRGYFGMNVAKVLEIIRQPGVTNVPNDHHPAAMGTFNLRNRVLPLVNLAQWLGKQGQSRPSDKVIVSEFSGVVTAFLVSGVTNIHRLSWDMIEAPGSYIADFSQDCVTGVIRLENRILFILDMEQIVASMSKQLDWDWENIEFEEMNSSFGEGCKVLIADDSLPIRRMMTKVLKNAGFTVDEASTGKEALSKLMGYKLDAQRKKAPMFEYVDLVVSDIEMPEMDGHTFLRNVNADPVLSCIPVVLFSSHITEALHQKGEQLRAAAQISKPDMPQLAKKVRAIIHERCGK